ncbi:MAG: hypothetical protein HQ594_07350 [Candidatus Omnitrophica bacterium]|nr:hypothetical protein [Candidatus Omnitrophota bacterium]
MQAQSAMPVRTFTIGFHEDRYNEAVSARGVAEHLGTDHTELYVTPDELRETIPSLPNIYDEPFSDSSQVPTYLISKLTRSHVTVSLSGDGGDENFGGYNRYLWAKRVWDGTRRVPVFMRSGLSGLMKGVSPQRWDSLSERCTSFMPGIFDHRLFGDKLHKLADALTCTSPDELYSALVSHWRDPASMVLGSREPLTILQDEKVRKAIPDFVDRMMFLDLVTYLPGDILQKVDRASMAVSLEARVPLLDHRVVEFAKRLPLSVKIKDAKSKWILRKVLSRHVPEELIERPKMGFGVPIDNWLRGPLREWAEDLLDENNMKKDGILDPRPVRKIWDEHLSGRKNWQYHLWDVLMFQAWKRKWM